MRMSTLTCCKIHCDTLLTNLSIFFVIFKVFSCTNTEWQCDDYITVWFMPLSVWKGGYTGIRLSVCPKCPSVYGCNPVTAITGIARLIWTCCPLSPESPLNLITHSITGAILLNFNSTKLFDAKHSRIQRQKHTTDKWKRNELSV